MTVGKRIKYFFEITEPNGQSYDFEAYFENHDIASQFIDENKRDGNTVVIKAPYYKEVLIDEEASFNAMSFVEI